ncbi:MAG TPA: TauD/TfdA family dioxygenase [Myxococcota bacterium]|nr:TauD/TfdA family dioxygenase [Myxococcota bacterium]
MAGPELRIEPLGASLGAEVCGVDLKRPLEPETVAALRRLVLDRLALFFPDQHLSPDEQRTFMRGFGEVEAHPERPQVLAGSDEEVVVISPANGVSAVWHCDYDPDFVPCGLCTLNMVECAADGGGDTIFVSSYRLYAELSAPLRRLADGLTAVHRNLGNRGRRRDEAEYPLVGIHPETGRQGLLYSAHHVQDFVELAPAESALLLAHLRALTARPGFAIRHHWRPGTLAFWDNRCVQHYAVPDFTGPRLLYQVSVRAELPRPTPGWRPVPAAERAPRASDVAPRY